MRGWLVKMMTQEELEMHLRAGKYYGKDATCGKKIDYKSEATAAKSAAKLSNPEGKTLEGYPCYWCSGWHIGRALTQHEIWLFSSAERVEALGDSELIEADQTDKIHGFQLGVRPLIVHSRSLCEGEYCSIHNPSNHPLRDAPLNWRADRRIMERYCPHGVGHPDPDDYQYRLRTDPDADTIHGCDGCC